MNDFSRLIEDADRERELQKTTTLADRFDFDSLREINRDVDGKTINSNVDIFLDWSSALLRRIPSNWEDYLTQRPADLQIFLSDTTDILGSLEQAGNASMGARGSELSALSSRIQPAMSRSLNSLRELILLQMIGEERSNATKTTIDRIRKSEDQVRVTLEAAERHAEQLKEMAEASQEVTSKIAASGRARIFHTDGKNFESAAFRWLCATSLLGAILVFLALGLAFECFLVLPSGADNGQIASHIFSKLLLLATLGAAITFSAKQYAVNRHNAVQNFHRSSALRTYRALLAASRDEAIHDVMLHQAAQAIFAPSDTGYAKQGSAFDQNPMVQLFQGVSKNAGGNPS